MIVSDATWEFVRKYADSDVRKLALQAKRDTEADLPIALQLIAGRQTARKKLPAWAAVEDIVYPPHLNMEQCSSEQTARYKAAVVGRLFSGTTEKGTFIDLTGGFGVDFYWMSQRFGRRVYVEQSQELCAIARHNFAQLGLECSICCTDSATYLAEMQHASLVYIDPARRNEHGSRTYGIADCTPNVLQLMPVLKDKADFIVLKLSPMLDWRKAVDDLSPTVSVSEVHIVSADNECKELLLVLGKKQCDDGLRLCCVNNDTVFKIDSAELKDDLLRVNGLSTSVKRAFPSDQNTSPLFLYEPNASIMKAGCFAVLEQRYPVWQVAPNSHLFLSSEEIDIFPGRRFRIEAISSMNKRELSAHLRIVKQGNISVRNFPQSAEELRKKLKLKDGGDTYIFATTTEDGQHKLFICRKIG